MRCPNCDTQASPGDGFCGVCGRPLAAQAAAPDATATAPRVLQDVLPTLRRSANTIWAEVEKARDELLETVGRTCREEGYEALVIKSDPFIQPAWVKVECWIPSTDGKVSGRAWAIIKIHAKEFHRHAIEHSVELHDRGWSRSYERLVGFGEHHATQIARFVLGLGACPQLGVMQVRGANWQLWRPLNKLDVLGVDWLRFAPAVPLVTGVLVLAQVPLLGLLLLGAGVAVVVALRRRRAPVLSSGKPRAEPRKFHAMDSWQTVVSGLGGDAATLHTRMLDLIETPPMEGFDSRVERIWEWGLDGIVERDQLVMTLRRAWVFCQIYGYQNELYVGWTANLNSGQWVEKTVATGIDKQTRTLIRVNSVERGSQALSGYDVVDMNCLAEWTHARLVKLLRELMEEHEVEQEVDFKIIRGDRPTLGETPKPADQIRSGVGQLGRRLVRTR